MGVGIGVAVGEGVGVTVGVAVGGGVGVGVGVNKTRSTATVRVMPLDATASMINVCLPAGEVRLAETDSDTSIGKATGPSPVRASIPSGKPNTASETGSSKP